MSAIFVLVQIKFNELIYFIGIIGFFYGISVGMYVSSEQQLQLGYFDKAARQKIIFTLSARQDLANDGGGDPMAPMGGGGGTGLEGMDPASLTVDQLGQSDTLEQILRALSQQGGQDEWQRIMGGA